MSVRSSKPSSGFPRRARAASIERLAGDIDTALRGFFGKELSRFALALALLILVVGTGAGADRYYAFVIKTRDTLDRATLISIGEAYERCMKGYRAQRRGYEQLFRDGRFKTDLDWRRAYDAVEGVKHVCSQARDRAVEQLQQERTPESRVDS